MSKPFKHLVIVAGEESGDMHAALIIRQLKTTYPHLHISGMGGKHMEDAGVDLIFNLAQFGITGYTDIVRHFKSLRKAFLIIKRHLEESRPDLLVLVDYPGFNLRLAQYAKKKWNLKILYYISPQIWGWKANRIHTIKQCVDTMAVILPFEKALYEKAKVPVKFVGHPLVEKINAHQTAIQSRMELNLPIKNKIIALLPGSRLNEIERHMPVLRDTAQLMHQQDKSLHFIIPVAQTLPKTKIESYFQALSLPLTIISGKALDAMNAADFVIVASGTASLECALLLKPMCIIYKTSFINYYLATKLIKVKFLGLANLLVNKMMVPEFLQHDCNPIELTRYFNSFYEEEDFSHKIIAQLSALKDSLSSKKTDCLISDLIGSELLE